MERGYGVNQLAYPVPGDVNGVEGHLFKCNQISRAIANVKKISSSNTFATVNVVKFGMIHEDGQN